MRPQGWEVCPALQETASRGVRRGQLPHAQRNPQLRKGLGWQIAPQPKLAARSHTALASQNPKEGETQAGTNVPVEEEKEPAGRLRSLANRPLRPTPQGCPRRDLRLPAGKAQHTPDEPARRLRTCGHEYTCTHKSTGAHTCICIHAQGPQVHIGVLTQVSLDTPIHTLTHTTHSRASSYRPQRRHLHADLVSAQLPMRHRLTQGCRPTCTHLDCTCPQVRSHGRKHRHRPRRVSRQRSAGPPFMLAIVGVGGWPMCSSGFLPRWKSRLALSSLCTRADHARYTVGAH